MSANKEIRVTAAMDTGSFGKLVSQVRELQQEAGKLAEIFQRLNAGHGASPLNVAGVGGTPAGGNSSAQQATQAASAGVGGGLARFAKGVTDGFRGAKTAVGDAMTGISSVVRDTVTAVEPGLRRIESLLSSLGNAAGRAVEQTHQAAGAPATPGARTRAKVRVFAPAPVNVGDALRAAAQADTTTQAGVALPALGRMGATTDQVIRGYERSLQALTAAHDRVAARVGTDRELPGDSRRQARYQDLHAERMDDLRDARSKRGAIMDASGLLRDRVKRARGNGALPPPPEEAASEGGGGGGMFGALGRFAGPAALGYAAYKAYGMVTGALASNEKVNVAEEMRREWFGMERSAAAGRSFGQTGLAIRHGDAARSWAQMEALKDPAFQRLMNKDNLARREQAVYESAGVVGYTSQVLKDASGRGRVMTTPSGLTPGVLRGQAGEYVGQATTRIGDAIANHPASAARAVSNPVGLGAGLGVAFGEWLNAKTGLDDKITSAIAGPARAAQMKAIKEEWGGGVDAVLAGQRSKLTDETRRKSEIEAEHGIRKTTEEMMGEMVKAIQLKLEANPMFADRLNSTYGGAMGDLAMYRTAGISGNFRYDPKTGKAISHGGTDFERAAFARGYEPGEVAGGRAALAVAAGRGFIGRDLLDLRHGGLANADQLFAAGSQTGGYTGRGQPGLLRGVQGSVGVGGVDVLAGSQIGGAFAAQTQGGNWYDGTGEAGLRGVAASIWTPGGPGEITSGQEMRAARQATAGLGAMAEQFGGGIDPLGGALSYRAAVQAAPGLGYYAHDALIQLGKTPGQLLDVIRSGRVPQPLAALGIGIEHIKRFYAEQQKSQNLSRVVERSLSGSSKETFQRFRKAGGNVARFMDDTLQRGMGGGDVARMRDLSGKGRLSRGETRELQTLRRRAQATVAPEFGALARVEATANRKSYDEMFGSLMDQASVEEKDLHGAGAWSSASLKSLAGEGAKARAGLAGNKNADLTDDENTGGTIRKVIAGMPGMEKLNAKAQAAAAAGDGKDLGASAKALDSAFGMLTVAAKTLEKALYGAAGSKSPRPITGRPGE